MTKALVAIIVAIWLTASGIAVARSFPQIPDEIEVHHSVEIDVEGKTSHQVDVEGELDPGRLRIDPIRITGIPSL